MIVCYTTMDPAVEAQLAEFGIEVHSVPPLPEPLTNDAAWIAETLITTAKQFAPVAYYASGVGGAAALIAAAQRPDLVSAVVAINARTDRAFDYLRQVHAPTLLLVTEMPVLLMNREAVATMKCEKRLEVIHGADCAATVAAKAVRWLTEKTLVAQPA